MKTQNEIIKEYELLLKQSEKVSPIKKIELLKLSSELKTLQIKEIYENINNLYKLLDNCIENINTINNFLSEEFPDRVKIKEDKNENNKIKNK